VKTQTERFSSYKEYADWIRENVNISIINTIPFKNYIVVTYVNFPTEEEPPLVFPAELIEGYNHRGKQRELAEKIIKEESETEHSAEFFHQVVFSRDSRSPDTIMCTLETVDGFPIRRGEASCHPDDAFSELIGKAIALLRAKDKEIPNELLGD
jgi:hypothetical protein